MALLCVAIVVIMDFGTGAGASTQDVVLFAHDAEAPPSALSTHRTRKLPCNASCRKAAGAIESAKLALHTAKERVVKEKALAKRLWNTKNASSGQKKAATQAIMAARQAATAAHQAYAKAFAKYRPVLAAFRVHDIVKVVRMVSTAATKSQAEAKQAETERKVAIKAAAATAKARLKVQRLQRKVHQSLHIVAKDQKLDDIAWQAAARAVAPDQFQAVHRKAKRTKSARPAIHRPPANKWLAAVQGAWSGVEHKEHKAVQAEENKIEKLAKHRQQKAAEQKVIMSEVNVAHAKHTLKKAKQRRSEKTADEAVDAMIKSQTHPWTKQVTSAVGWGYQYAEAAAAP